MHERGASLRTPLRAGSALLCLLCLLCGCNDVLDIDKPSDRVLVIGGLIPLDDAGSDAAVVMRDEDAGFDSDVLGPHASWPMPNPITTGLPNPQAYTATPEGYVTDNVTGLQWEQPIDSQSLSLADAGDHCAAIKVKKGEAFRLPTRIELLSLLDFTAKIPSIDNKTFPGTPGDYFWTSSIFSTDKSSAWVISFDPSSGFLSSSQLDTQLRVRCVRASEQTEPTHFTIERDVVTDSATKLRWQREVSTTPASFEGATKQCQQLGADWRLPTVKELQTLVDEKKQSPSIDRTAFPATPSDAFWTSSGVVGQASQPSAADQGGQADPVASPTQAWSVSFRFGFDAAMDRSMPLFVRCVR